MVLTPWAPERERGGWDGAGSWCTEGPSPPRQALFTLTEVSRCPLLSCVPEQVWGPALGKRGGDR